MAPLLLSILQIKKKEKKTQAFYLYQEAWREFKNLFH